MLKSITLHVSEQQALTCCTVHGDGTGLPSFCTLEDSLFFFTGTNCNQKKITINPSGLWFIAYAFFSLPLASTPPLECWPLWILTKYYNSSYYIAFCSSNHCLYCLFWNEHAPCNCRYKGENSITLGLFLHSCLLMRPNFHSLQYLSSWGPADRSTVSVLRSADLVSFVFKFCFLLCGSMYSMSSTNCKRQSGQRAVTEYYPARTTGKKNFRTRRG